MRRNIFRLFFLVLILLPSIPSAETLALCSMHRENLSERDGSGYYWDLLRAIFEPQGLRLEIKSKPFKRCLHELDMKKVDGAVAVFKTDERSKKFTYPNLKLHSSSYGLIFLDKAAALLEGETVEKVGKIRGYDFSMWLPKKYKRAEVSNIQSAMLMLEAGRLNFHADDIQDIYFALKKMNRKPDAYQFKTILAAIYIYPLREMNVVSY